MYVHLLSNPIREVVQILLSAGASLADETRKGNTAIHIAAQNGYWEILALFAKNGANLRVVCSFFDVGLTGEF